MPDLHDLELLLRGPAPIVVIETHEEGRVHDLFVRVMSLHPRPLFKWTITDGLSQIGNVFSAELKSREPSELLRLVKATRTPGIYLLADFHPFLDSPINVRLLKDIALAHDAVPHTVVLISHALEIPPEIARFSTRFQLKLPNRRQLEQIVFAEARAWSARNPGRQVVAQHAHLSRLVDNLIGMPVEDARRLAHGAIDDDGAIDASDLPRVNRAKFELIGQDGVLAFEFDTARFADVGGLEGLKRWLRPRGEVFCGPSSPGLDVPKGLLLLGIQGCGKSLAAKSVAGAWGLALLRLDVGALFDKFHGESERKLRDTLKQAEAMAPCVLWVDEIEKGLATSDHDSGTSRRLLATLLTWMAEKTARVFVVATANDIDALPPELLRKGRLDEIFFVDLPDARTRREVLAIHAKKRGLDPDRLDLDAVAAATEGFSGAELEQVVVSARYAAHARGRAVDEGMLREEARRTRPLSVVMAERISALRAWAAGRTVPAH